METGRSSTPRLEIRDDAAGARGLELRTNGTRDTVEVEVASNGASAVDTQYLAWFEVAYLRVLTAAADTIAFAAPDSVAPGRYQYAISAVSDTAAAWLLDRTDPETPVRLAAGMVRGRSFVHASPSRTARSGARRRPSLVSAARASLSALALYAPASSARSIADLLDPANEADYLIVAPPAFVAAAESLAAYRESRPLPNSACCAPRSPRPTASPRSRRMAAPTRSRSATCLSWRRGAGPARRPTSACWATRPTT